MTQDRIVIIIIEPQKEQARSDGSEQPCHPVEVAHQCGAPKRECGALEPEDLTAGRLLQQKDGERPTRGAQGKLLVGVAKVKRCNQQLAVLNTLPRRMHPPFKDAPIGQLEPDISCSHDALSPGPCGRDELVKRSQVDLVSIPEGLVDTVLAVIIYGPEFGFCP